jgi:hypothetical protein
VPGSVLTGASIATATSPTLVSTLFGVPSALTSMSNSFVGAEGFGFNGA